MTAVTIKYDVSGADHDANASDAGEFVTPPKGVYVAKLVELNKGFSKDGDGKPDKSRPRLECIYEIVGEADGSKPEARYGRLYDYVSFSDAAEWKLDQFLQAMGVDTRKKEKGQAKIEVGTVVKLRVRHEADNRDPDGPPRARVGGLFKFDGSEDGLDLEDELDEELDEDEADDEPEDEDWGDEDEDEDEDDEPELTAEDIDNMGGAELKALVKQYGLKPKKGSKVGDVRALLKEELGLDEEDDDDVPF